MNNESFDALLKRLNNQEKQQVIEYAYMFDDLRYLREHDRYLKKQLEAYKNAVGKVIGLIYDYQMNDKDNSNYEEMLYFLKNIGSDK